MSGPISVPGEPIAGAAAHPGPFYKYVGGQLSKTIGTRARRGRPRFWAGPVPEAWRRAKRPWEESRLPDLNRRPDDVSGHRRFRREPTTVTRSDQAELRRDAPSKRLAPQTYL